MSDALTHAPEAEAEIRAIARHCRGPRNQAIGEVLPTLSKNQVAGWTLVEPLAALPDATTDTVIAGLFAADEKELAAAVDNASRRHCGQDVNAMILAEQLDGADHEAACPSCGTVIQWTPADYGERAPAA